MKTVFHMLAVCLIMPAVLFPAVYYVSPGGNDTHAGTSQTPWASPGWGSKQIAGGDTLIIMGGTYILSDYWDDMITPPSGSENAPTVIVGESGSRTVLAGRDNLYSAVELSDQSDITIKNLEITSDNGALFREGVSASGLCERIILEDLYIHHMDEFGIDFQDLRSSAIRNCDIQYCGFGAVGGPQGEAGGWRDVSITDCSLSYGGHYYQGETGPGTGPYDRPDGVGLEHAPDDGPLLIQNCRAEHNRGDGLDSKVNNTTILNCMVANNTCDGIKLWGGGSVVANTVIYGTGDGDLADSPWAALVIDNIPESGARFDIIHTTIHQDPRKRGYMLYSQYDIATPVTINMINTIVTGGSGPAWFGPSVTVTLDHCLIYREGESVQVAANGRDYTAADLKNGLLGAGCISGDPMFESPAWGAEGSYRLTAGSPAVDAGIMTAGGPLPVPDTDLDGRPRPAGAAPDMGAYEYGSGTGISRTASPAARSPIFFRTGENVLEAEAGEPALLTVYNILGRAVLVRRIQGHTAVPLHLPCGLYIAVLDPGPCSGYRFAVIH